MRDETSANRIRLPVMLGLAVLCLLAYSNSFYKEFQYDDIHLIRFNFTLRNLSDWKGILQFEFFRPVSLATFALNFWISQKDPFSYHVVNLVLHFLAVAQFYLLLHRTSGRWFYSAIAAALMATHPLNTESVTYIASRSILLCAVFYFWALLIFDSYLREPRWQRILLFVSVFALGLLSKEEAAAIPLAALLYNFVFFGRDSVWKHRLFHAATIALVLTAGLFRTYVELKYGGSSHPPFVYVATEVNVWIRYLWLAIYPVSLNVDHYIPPLTLTRLEFWYSFLAIAAMIVGLWKLRRQHALFAFWGLWFFLNLLPSSVFPLNDFMSEHRTYLSLFGFCASLAYLIILFQKASRPSRLVAGVLIFQIAFYAMATLRRNQIWLDEVSLWSDSVQKSPNKVRPHLNLGAALIRGYRFDDAIREYGIARSLNPDNAGAYNGLGFCYLNKYSLEEARRNFELALKIDPNYIDAKTGMGIVLYRQGKFTEALSYFLQVYPLRQESVDLVRMISESYVRSGHQSDAIPYLLRGMQLQPSNPYWQAQITKSSTRKSPVGAIE